MDTGKIEELLAACSPEDLRTIEAMVYDRLKKVDANCSKLSDDLGRKQRRDDRFDVNYLGTLTRITDVRPGERKEYSVTIRDVSRGGMCLWVDVNFAPSRVVEVSFSAPGGKIKKCQLEIVRMRKRNTDGGSWLELGCQIIHKDDVRRLRLQEEHLAKVRSKVQSMGKVNILVVGTRLESLRKVLTSPAGLRQYIVKFTESHRDVLDAIKKNPTQMIIFGQGDMLLSDPQLKACFDARPPAMATLAIIEREDARKQLLQAGIDECLSDNSCEEFIFRAIERALLGHAVGSTAPRQLSGEVLIVSVHNARVNLISFLLEENGYNVCITNTLAEAKYQVSHCFDAVFADYQPGNSESCAAIMEHFSGLPLIALCDQLSDGREAVEKGASNYLCMPLDKEDIRMIIKQLMSTTAPTLQTGTSAIT